MLICAILSTAISIGTKNYAFVLRQLKLEDAPVPAQNKVADEPMPRQFQLSTMFNYAICTAVGQVTFAADIIFSLFGVLLLTNRPKSRKVPALYFPVVLYRLFQGIR